MSLNINVKRIKTTPRIAKANVTISDSIKKPPALLYAGGLVLVYFQIISNAITAFDHVSVEMNLPFLKSLA
jgi:hypothetical protein